MYVALGSYCILQKWSVEAIYNGLKKLGVRVVWSLKPNCMEYLPVKDDPDFWISPWNPQVELLSHPAIKAGLSHCGWGGTMEYIQSGTPMVAFPHFFDQFKNADLICKENNAGIILHSKMRFSMDPEFVVSYTDPAFD